MSGRFNSRGVFAYPFTSHHSYLGRTITGDCDKHGNTVPFASKESHWLCVLCDDEMRQGRIRW